jgi:3-deoxy-D-manno-octulosonate 8-phosphate phosphatase (KDO 8-P phosphatase)
MTRLPDDELEALALQARKIELLLLDVDGVLTDGGIWYSGTGDELKRFHVRDGSGLKLWQSVGLRAGVLSGRSSPAVDRRAKELGLTPVIQGRNDKGAAFREILSQTGLTPEQVCGIGDDLPDLPLLRQCGLAITVADAAEEVQAMAAHTTTRAGGCGAVREAIEWLLKLRGQWQEAAAQYH